MENCHHGDRICFVLKCFKMRMHIKHCKIKVVITVCFKRDVGSYAFSLVNLNVF